MARKLDRTLRAVAWIQVWRLTHPGEWPLIKNVKSGADVGQGTAYRALLLEKAKIKTA
jgi:hypothetical protein